ncbi:alanine racemase [Candidatus Daviesbacteria bacterium RIFCSPHIGHO2_01_FULL_40_11]|uniref:Alanine racemase n=1 Tax=Candidatus Daviesbacteria bacterium RIFCSPHIGHO2_01_FULL_40_11 TaxID=1797762 RepID=A0A1F5JLU4_9BACT|nr:MAG: alanine racemase [Candidatus Daviesbacteria bacterium RIFCSPHIGHO2_01_FULL_40_11]OGE62593.1 MAG: alanine racemase [Candidatus Daviesbacteria bacterium RIFCSPLOWO2_01_FULL_40_27]
MIDRFLNFFRKSYQTLNIIKVSRDNLLQNFNYVAALDKKVKIAPVVKSNGYGHGIINVAKILDPKNTPYFCVDSLFEAYQLQKAKVKTPVLVIGYTNPENLKFKKLPFSFAVFDLETVKVLNKFQPNCGVHIFVDTGMRREGVTIEELPNFLNNILKLPNVKIEGLMSHLASSKSRTDPLFLAQIKQFKKAKEIFKKMKVHPKWFHIGATGSLVNPETRPIIAGVSNLARAGLALYGFSSSTFDENLKPALSLTSKIVQIKKVSKGEKLGYEGTFTAKKDTLVGVLPIGYYDGVDRRLSNKGIFLVDNIECPVLGRVCMNINIINLKLVPNPKVGQEVIVYSGNPEDKNSIGNCAKRCKTIPYDLLVNLAETTRRIVV